MNSARLRPLTLGVVVLVALAHVWFFVLESVLFATPLGLQTFHITAEQAATMRVLAMNQGVYNAFLASALVAGAFFVKDVNAARALTTFGLVCVVVAGIVGGLTANPAIFGIQAMPAVIALILVRVDARRAV